MTLTIQPAHRVIKGVNDDKEYIAFPMIPDTHPLVNSFPV